ncbi:MAG: hypothetical protein ACTSP0_01395 [Alphaproteobacteria bacterium]
MRRFLVRFACAFFILAPAICVAQTTDPHAVFEERCSRCHTPHAGQFARKALTILPGGQITGRKTNEPIQTFLADHSGHPSPAQIAALIDMFTMQLNSGGLFERKCRICHDSAKKLARVRLEMKNGKLVDRITSRDTYDFLTEHGRLNAGEVEVINKLLIWQLRTAGR